MSEGMFYLIVGHILKVDLYEIKMLVLALECKSQVIKIDPSTSVYTQNIVFWLTW